MTIISQILCLVDVDNREGKMSDVAILNEHARTLHLVPMVYRPVRVAHHICSRIGSQSHIRPVIDTIG